MGKVRRFRESLRKPVSERTIQEKLLVSGGFALFDHTVSILFRFGSTLIITRLLAPEIFGLFALIMTFQTITVLLTDFGVRSLIIVSENAGKKDFLRVCWTAQLIRGVALSGIVALIALGIAAVQAAGLAGDSSVFSNVDLPIALALSGLALALQGSESVNQHVHAREMRFGKITLMNVAAIALGPTLTITVALWWPTIWALVISLLVMGVIKSLMTHIIFSGVRMRLCWNRNHAAELFGRGKWIMGHSSLYVASITADILMLGAFIPASYVGQYYLANQFIEIPRALVLKMESSFGMQFFQHFSISSNESDIKSKYYRFRIPIDIITCIFTGGFITASPAVIELLYDDRYQDVGQMMQILALGLPITGMNVIRNAYSAQKRFKIMTLVSMIQTISIWLGLIVALPVFGSLIGALFVIALYRIPEIAVLLFMAKREGWIDLVKEVRLFPFIAIGAIMGLGFDLLLDALVS